MSSSAASLQSRTLLIFGGAYLLRALTDLEFLPPGAGLGVAIFALLGNTEQWIIPPIPPTCQG